MNRKKKKRKVNSNIQLEKNPHTQDRDIVGVMKS